MANDEPHVHRLCFASIALLALIAYVPPLRASDPLSPGEHFATVNDVRLWYRVAGHGPVLVIQAPEWGPTSFLLQRFLAPLDRNLTVVYFDPRGSGKSSRPAKDTLMSTLDMADDLEAFRSYLGLERIAVLGHSHGAQIAAVFAAKHPDHISHLVLADGGIHKNPTPEIDAEVQKIYDRLAKDPRYADAVKATREPSPETGEGFSNQFKRMAPLFWHDVTKAQPLEGLSIDPWEQSAFAKSENQATFDLVADLKKLSAPTLIIEGKDDLIVPNFVQEQLRNSIPHSRIVVFEESGHFPMIEEQEKFTQVVGGFVRE
jgi:pimeloyl-ACP methyl ester carboxylesterase